MEIMEATRADGTVRLEIWPDEYAESPRQDRDNLGTLVFPSERYIHLGDDPRWRTSMVRFLYDLGGDLGVDPDRLERLLDATWEEDENPQATASETLRKIVLGSPRLIALPLTVFDDWQPQVRVWGQDRLLDWDNDGYLYVTAERVREELSVQRITKGVRERTLRYLASEIEELNTYLRGEVVGFKLVEVATGAILDSVWNFYALGDIADYLGEEDRKLLEQLEPHRYCGCCKQRM